MDDERRERCLRELVRAADRLEALADTADLMGDDEYARVIRDLIAKTPGLPTVTELLDSIVKATVAYAKAQVEPEPLPVHVPATFSAGSSE